MFLRVGLSVVVMVLLSACAGEISLVASGVGESQVVIEDEPQDEPAPEQGNPSDSESPSEPGDSRDDGDAGADVDQPSSGDRDLAACKKRLGGRPRVVIAGRAGVHAFESDQSLIIKVVGTQNSFRLKLKGAAERVERLCVIVAGDRNSVSAEIAIPVGLIHYIGRGNQSKGEFLFLGSARAERYYGFLAGNGASLKSSFESGEPSCPTVLRQGNAGQSICP